MNKKNRILWVLPLLLCAVCCLSLRVGSVFLSGREFWGGLLGTDGFSTESLILYGIRLPRLFGALIAGSGLSLSGLLLQKVTGNALAGPNIIGVNAGAGFGVMLTLFFAPTLVLLLPITAFGGAFLATLLIVGLAYHRSKSTVILAGVSISALLNAGISFFSLLDPDVLASYNHFSIGGLSGVQTKELLLPALLIGICFLIILLFGSRIDCLSLGDAVASSLGVRVGSLRALCLILASACAAAAVSFAGLLGFVGLMVPHIARRLAPVCFRLQTVCAALLGGVLLVLADLLGRVLFAPSELPVGILTALIGAPFFFYLLIRRKRYASI